MNKRVAILLVYCLAIGGYAVTQSNPQSAPTSGQASSAPQADTQSTPKNDDAADSKNAKAQPATAPAAAPNLKIPSGSKIYVAPMAGFESYVVAGIMKKKVPVTIVNDRNKADYEINGAADTQKAGWAKIVFLKTDATTEEATINVTEIKTGAVVFAYSVHKGSSARGKQSAGEAIGKHLNEAIGKD